MKLKEEAEKQLTWTTLDVLDRIKERFGFEAIPLRVAQELLDTQTAANARIIKERDELQAKVARYEMAFEELRQLGAVPEWVAQGVLGDEVQHGME
jgi:hypothetical protein